MKSLCKWLSAIALLLQSSSLFFAQLPSYLPPNGLVAWYPFNGNANDESGNGNDGVVNGATLAVDRFGLTHKAYQFDGIDDFIEVPVQQQSISSYAIMCWFKFPTSPISGDYKALVQASGGYPNSQYSLSLQMSANPLFPNQADNKISVSINGPGVFNGRISNSTYNDDVWHCLVGVWDAPDGAQTSSSFVKMYLDGALINESTTAVDYGSVLTPVSGYGNTLIGMMNHLIGGRYYQGGIDDIAIYNRALSAAEVTALYTATPTNTGGGATSTSPAPPGIPYQAEVRSDNGEVLANANVNVRFTLHELTANGTVSYQETHTLTTNELGLFAATIGAGTPTQGTFAGINWSQTTKFLQVEVDPGSGYITMGNQQLMSVPYALYAANGPAGPQGPVGPQGPSGADGQQGAPGANGLSAYEVWLAQGNTGTEADFLNSIGNGSVTETNEHYSFSGSINSATPLNVATIALKRQKALQITGSVDLLANQTFGSQCFVLQLKDAAGNDLNMEVQGLVYSRSANGSMGAVGDVGTNNVALCGTYTVERHAYFTCWYYPSTDIVGSVNVYTTAGGSANLKVSVNY